MAPFIRTHALLTAACLGLHCRVGDILLGIIPGCRYVYTGGLKGAITYLLNSCIVAVTVPKPE